jgi:hypothetical protein
MYKSYKYDINNRSPLAFTICKKNGPTENILNVKLEDLSIKLLILTKFHSFHTNGQIYLLQTTIFAS